MFFVKHKKSLNKYKFAQEDELARPGKGEAGPIVCVSQLEHSRVRARDIACDGTLSRETIVGGLWLHVVASNWNLYACSLHSDRSLQGSNACAVQ